MICETCRFDSAAWSISDLRRTLLAVPLLVAAHCEGAPPPVDAALRTLFAPLDGPADTTLEAVHRAMHAFADAGRLRYALGAGASSGTGTVVQISTSGGGVPKTAVDRVRVTAAGVGGDRQGNRTHHGRPWQAVCLWSAEVIAGLQAEGHPIGWGSAGENLTLAGLDWAALRPGVRLTVGDVLLELTAYTIPCRKNARWFTDGYFRRMAHEVTPGTSRLYARVLVDGTVSTGDEVTVEPGVVPAQARPHVQLELSAQLS